MDHRLVQVQMEVEKFRGNFLDVGNASGGFSGGLGGASVTGSSSGIDGKVTYEISWKFLIRPRMEQKEIH